MGALSQNLNSGSAASRSDLPSPGPFSVRSPGPDGLFQVGSLILLLEPAQSRERGSEGRATAAGIMVRCLWVPRIPELWDLSLGSTDGFQGGP